VVPAARPVQRGVLLAAVDRPDQRDVLGGERDGPERVQEHRGRYPEREAGVHRDVEVAFEQRGELRHQQPDAGVDEHPGLAGVEPDEEDADERHLHEPGESSLRGVADVEPVPEPHVATSIRSPRGAYRRK
jgi:hypothetical protein